MIIRGNSGRKRGSTECGRDRRRTREDLKKKHGGKGGGKGKEITFKMPRGRSIDHRFRLRGGRQSLATKRLQSSGDVQKDGR